MHNDSSCVFLGGEDMSKLRNRARAASHANLIALPVASFLSREILRRCGNGSQSFRWIWNYYTVHLCVSPSCRPISYQITALVSSHLISSALLFLLLVLVSGLVWFTIYSVKAIHEKGYIHRDIKPGDRFIACIKWNVRSHRIHYSTSHDTHHIISHHITIHYWILFVLSIRIR